MRVLHVIPSVSAAHGGPSAALRAMAAATAARGVEVEIATTDDDGPGKRLSSLAGNGPHDVDGMRVRFFPKQTERYKFSLPLSRWLRRHARCYDVLHVHALFSFASAAAARAARAAGVPYVVRPLGALGRYGMTRRRPWLKRLWFPLVERPVLEGAAAVHFTSRQELSEARQVMDFRSVAVIPLGVDLPERGPGPGDGARRQKDETRPSRIAFLGRIDPVKNLESLIEALARVARTIPGVTLAIAGAGDAAYEAQLRRRVDALGLGRAVEWLGHLEDVEKQALLGGVDVLVLPSHSENFGIAAVEALASGVPCVLGRGVAIASEVEAAAAGVAVDPSPEAIADGLAALLCDGPRLRAASRAARRLAEERYSVQRMGADLVDLYARVRAT